LTFTCSGSSPSLYICKLQSLSFNQQTSRCVPPSSSLLLSPPLRLLSP
jgi:hypothetical protein